MRRAEEPGADVPDPEGGPGPKKPPRRKPVPSPDTVVSETTLTSPKGRVYRVLRTNQTDPYDEPASESEDRPADETAGKPAGRPSRRKGKGRRKS
jgi:hypothetical protein